MMPCRFALAAFLLASLALAACTSRTDAARELFVNAHACPSERVEIVELQGQSVYELRRRAHPGGEVQPPAEVAGDPARLALWHRQRADAERTTRWVDDRYRIYRASGCGLQTDYACQFLWSEKGAPRGQCATLAQVLR